MIKLLVTIVRIDEYGFNGRDFHPGRHLIGQRAIITKMTTFCEEGPELRLEDESQNHGDAPYTVLEGITEAGERVELIDHEVRYDGIAD